MQLHSADAVALACRRAAGGCGKAGVLALSGQPGQASRHAGHVALPRSHLHREPRHR